MIIATPNLRLSLRSVDTLTTPFSETLADATESDSSDSSDDSSEESDAVTPVTPTRSGRVAVATKGAMGSNWG